ncbi:hypothetical protein DFP73DRAFT_268116 [Morchella snyderi]|nr:hypothetical protein DFP73DRAFT_268116 [Morchella snyderi]
MAFINRVNRVQHYQRLFQNGDGWRQWVKTPKSKYLLTPYFICIGVGVTGSVWGMSRMVAGKKTFF